MKILRALTILSLFTGLVFAQVVNGKGTKENDNRSTTVSGTPIIFQDSIGTLSNNFEVLITGSPGTMSIPVQGCMRGGTCSTLTTSAATTNSVISTSGQYDYYTLTPTWTGGTNPTVTFNRTGTIAKSSTGSSASGGVIFAAAGATPPTPVGANTCPSNASGWTQNAAGVYQTQFGVDSTLSIPSTGSSFGSPGILVSCRPMVFNSTGGATVGANNGTAFNVYGRFDAFTNSAFAIQGQYTNSLTDNQTYTTGNMSYQYVELEINGTPTINTTFVSTERMRMDDNRTGGNKPKVWSVYQGETAKNAVHDITNCGGVGIDGFSSGAPCYSVWYGEQSATLLADEDETGAIYDLYSGGTKDISHHALNATGEVFHALVQASTNNRFANSRGFVSEDFGLAAGYFNIYSKGVNASGTQSGYNAFQGPSEFGALTQPAAGVQVEIQGGALNHLATYTGVTGYDMAKFVLTETPSGAAAGGVDVISASNTSAISVAMTGRIRGGIFNASPSGAGAISRIEAINASANSTGTAVALNIAGYFDAEMLNTSGTTGNNRALMIQSGQAAAGGTLTQDDGINIQAPTTSGSMTHHAAIHILQNQSVNTGSNNPDGWAILEDGSVDKNKFGLLFTTSDCASSGGTCAGAPNGKVSIAAAATTVTVATTAVTAASEIHVQEDATLGTALSVTCNTTTGRTYTVTTRTPGTSFVITASVTPGVNPACLSYHIMN